MIKSVRSTFLTLAALYSLVLAWVWAGVFYASGTTYSSFFAIQIGSFLVAGTLAYVALPLGVPLAKLGVPIKKSQLAHALLFVILGVSVLHWIVLGEIPLLAATRVQTALAAAEIRESIQHPSILLANYIPALVIKSGAIVLAIYFLRSGNELAFWVVAIAGLIYAMSLMQKSYPLLILLPIALYSLLTHRFLRAAIFSVLAVAGVLTLFVVTNPQLTAAEPSLLPAHQVIEDEKPTPMVPRSEVADSILRPLGFLGDYAGTAANYLARRVVVVPGYVVSKWFDTFPAISSFDGGCGVRFLAPMLGCSFVNQPEHLYRLYNQETYKAGIQGSFNAAHFAQEYAHFGVIGLLLSGVLISIMLYVSAIFTSRAGLPGALAVNLYPIFALSSVAFQTTLLTHGWSFLIILTFLLWDPLGEKDNPDSV